MRRVALFNLTLLSTALLLSDPAFAQFGNLFNDIKRGATANTSKSDSSTASSSTTTNGTQAKADPGCKTEGGKRNKAMLGSILGGIASRTAGRAGMGSFVPVDKFSDTISSALACHLNEKEQEQAATATTKAVAAAERSAAPVGQPVAWTSESRPNVTGTSTVDSKTKLADGSRCMNVTDVIIVEGEETRVQKRMCRGPGQTRYVLSA